MILIAFLFIFAIYLFVFYRIARRLNHLCQQKGKNVLGKVLGGLIMFGAVAIIFWDAIPTWKTHDHLCHTEYGLKVYMTPDAWAKKYPERFSKIQPVSEYLLGEKINKPRIEIRIDHLNSEIDAVNVREMEYGFGVMRERRQFVDHKTGEILSEFIDFAGGISGGSIATGANSLADYKFWLKTMSCDFAYSDLSEKYNSDNEAAGTIFNTIREWGKK